MEDDNLVTAPRLQSPMNRPKPKTAPEAEPPPKPRTHGTDHSLRLESARKMEPPGPHASSSRPEADLDWKNRKNENYGAICPY